MPEPEYLHGAVLLLEDDETRDGMRAKCESMRALGLNTAVVWPPVFYKDGKRDFSIQRALLDCAAETGLKVVVELTGQVADLEYLPDCDWRPEYCVTDADGRPALMQNGLGECNYNHPGVRARHAEFFRETVMAYRDHPALLAWDIWNETHFLSFDEYTRAAFRRWLEKKYVRIEALDSAWKKSYTSFEQIRHDPITWASIVPDTDLEEFRTDNLADIAAEWRDIVRAADPDHPVFADNVMSNAVWSEFGRGTDDWKLASRVDLFGVSFYPKTGGRLLKENAAWLRNLTFAGAYSAGGGKFMVAEMQSHCYSEIFTAERVSPEELTSWSLEALFQGSRGCVYWKWEPFKAGFQLGGRGLALSDGTLSRRADAVRAFSAFLAEHPDARSLEPVARAAVVYDRLSNFTVKAVNNRVRHIIGDDQCARARFGAVKTAAERGVPVAVVTPEQILRDGCGMRVLILPYQLALTPEFAGALETYAADGGLLVLSFPFGDIDGRGRLARDLPGGPLNALLGARTLDNSADTLRGEELEVQEVEVAGAEVLLRTDSGRPLVLCREIGKAGGAVLYVASPFWNDAFDKGRRACADFVWDEILRRRPEAVPVAADTPVVLSRGREYDYLFVENEAGAPSCRIAAPADAELIFGEGAPRRDGDAWAVDGARNAVFRMRKASTVNFG